MQISSLLTDEAVLAELGARLTAARRAHAGTQESLAAAAGVSIATVGRAEAGEAISLPDLLRLLRAVDGLGGLDGLLVPGPTTPAPGVAAPQVMPACDPTTTPPEPSAGFVLRDNRGRQRTAGRRARGAIDRRSSGGPKPPDRFIWGDDPPAADA
ncbi:MAG: helix-turn-helix transcriptional regulator [Solirubrobacteraceae bacterium]|nr:helix-turn-helix transcriptional regulator [Solirubrobacteraceae bacterium]